MKTMENSWVYDCVVYSDDHYYCMFAMGTQS